MDEELYEIAKQNLKYKRNAIWWVSIGGAFFMGGVFWLLEGYQQILPWVVFSFGVSLMAYGLYLETKVVKKRPNRDPILEEMKRLEKAGFTSEDVEELKLKQIVKRNRDNDFV